MPKPQILMHLIRPQTHGDSQGPSRALRGCRNLPETTPPVTVTGALSLLLCRFEQMCLDQIQTGFVLFLKKTFSALGKTKRPNIFPNFLCQRKRQAYESNLICGGLQLEATRSVRTAACPAPGSGPPLDPRPRNARSAFDACSVCSFAAGRSAVSQNLPSGTCVCFWSKPADLISPPKNGILNACINDCFLLRTFWKVFYYTNNSLTQN